MKNLSIIIILMILAKITCLSRLSLRECWELTKLNNPLSRNIIIEEIISDHKINNLNSQYLPQLSLFGQVQYQSDVTKVEIPFPGINIPSIKNDQYKAGIFLYQILWDGGIIQNQKNVELTKFITQKFQLESDIYKLRQKVNDAFFGILLANAKEKAWAAADSDLTEKLRLISSRVKAGVLLQSNADILQAEIYKLRQNLDEIIAAKQSSLDILSELTGKNIIYDSLETSIAEIDIISDQKYNRIEFALFESHKNTLDAISDLNGSKYYPKFNIFAQGGYARPALNMLDPDFQFYYIVGIQATWNFWNWGVWSRENEIIENQKSLIDSQESAFTQHLDLIKIQYMNEIERLKTQLIKDDEIIALRKKITNQAFSQLQNGVVTSTEYLSQYWSEVKAELDRDSRNIQLLHLKYNLITLVGDEK